jgi:hypothetical protein
MLRVYGASAMRNLRITPGDAYPTNRLGGIRCAHKISRSNAMQRLAEEHGICDSYRLG